MTLPESIQEAAEELGRTLAQTSTVQEYLRAVEAVQADAELQQLEAKTNEVYQSLVARQKTGEMLFPYEVNGFYRMRDEYIRHPKIVAQNQSFKAVKALFEQAGATLSSVLSVDYTELAI